MLNYNNFSYSSLACRISIKANIQTQSILVFLTILLGVCGCSAQRLPREEGECKIQAYVNAVLPSYLSNRYHSEKPARSAVVPFDVPESFAPGGVQSMHYGRELANILQRELLRSAEMGIVEVFNRDRWPGKRSEFFTGNHGAISLARNAGYDFVVVGYLDEVVDDKALTFFTKVIDTSNNITVWYARTLVTFWGRKNRQDLSELSKGIIKSQPELFYFPERAELFANCTVEKMFPPFKPVAAQGLIGGSRFMDEP